MIIGIMGRKRSGKDTVAGVLCQSHGFTRRAFADKIRAVALAIDPQIVVYPGGPRHYQPGSYALSDIVDTFSWEWAKDHTTAREVLQHIGTGVRDHLGPTAWVDPVLAEIDGRTGPVVIPDVRFLNEVEAIRSRGGFIWEVHRPGIAGDDDTHVSEHEWRAAEADQWLNNAGDVGDLRAEVQLAYSLTKLRAGWANAAT